MRYLALFMVFVCLILWAERFYWQRRARLLELRILGIDRERANFGLFDAWLDGRIEIELQRKRGR